MPDERTAADSIRRTATVGNEDGLHMRPITLISQCAARFECTATVSKGETTADAKAMIQLLTLAAAHGDEVVVSATGPDAEEAADAIVALIESPDSG